MGADRITVLEQALRNIRELNMMAADENGHRWAHSDLIEQEIVSVGVGALDAARVPDVAALIEGHNWQIIARARHWLRRNLNCPEDADVEAVCEKYGYGAVMDAASRLWARKPYGFGAFYIGGCIGFSSDEDAIAAIRAIEGEA